MSVVGFICITIEMRGQIVSSKNGEKRKNVLNEKKEKKYSKLDHKNVFSLIEN